MKAKVAIVFGVLAATVCLALLMTVSPGRNPGQAAETNDLERPQPVTAVSVNGPQPPAAESAVYSPAVAEEDLAAIEERLRLKTDPLSTLNKLVIWVGSPRPRMAEEDYENARGLYLRFLDNFERIETAQFRVKKYEVLDSGTEKLFGVENIVSASSKFRAERTVYRDSKEARTVVSVCDGKTVCGWNEGRVVSRGKLGFDKGPFREYLFGLDMRLICEPRPLLLNYYSNCDIDNGSRGYSRLWDANGNEAHFDTATGMLTELRYKEGIAHTFTYQNVMVYGSCLSSTA